MIFSKNSFDQTSLCAYPLREGWEQKAREGIVPGFYPRPAQLGITPWGRFIHFLFRSQIPTAVESNFPSVSKVCSPRHPPCRGQLRIPSKRRAAPPTRFESSPLFAPKSEMSVKKGNTNTAALHSDKISRRHCYEMLSRWEEWSEAASCIKVFPFKSCKFLRPSENNMFSPL